MITLRSYNKRMGKLGAPKVKRSRRKYAVGGETSIWDPTYRDSSMESPGGTSLGTLQSMETKGLRKDYAKGGRIGMEEGGLYTEEELLKMQAEAGAVAPPVVEEPKVVLPRLGGDRPEPAPQANYLERSGLQQTDAPARPTMGGHPALPMLRRSYAVQPDEERRAETPIQNQPGVTTDSKMFGNLGQVTPVETPAAPGYTSDEEQARGGTNKMLGHYGLRAGSTRETTMPGGITKYKDASGKTLYANTTDLGGESGRVNVYESGPVAKQEADRLTGAIQARLASGDPADLEHARQLAVTPAHRALIADADNVRGLRQRVSMGDPAAALELQTRAQTGLARAKAAAESQAAMNTELFKHQLGAPEREREFGLKETELRAKLGKEQRDTNFTQNNAMIKNMFDDSTPEGKAAIARLHNRLAVTLPRLKGDISQLPPEQMNRLVVASKIMDLGEQAAKPGWFMSVFGAEQPRYEQILDMFDKAKIVSQGNWLHGGEIIFPNGARIVERKTDPGTWRLVTEFVGEQNRAPATPALKQAAMR